MISKLLISLSLSTLTVSASAQTNKYTTKEIGRLGLKVVHIKTVDNEEPSADFVEAPEGSMGMTSVNARKVPCRLFITQGTDTLYDSGGYEKSVSGATIKINGNTTAYFSEEGHWPFKLKLQKKTDLLLRNDERYADKEWRLLKDAGTLNTIVGLKVSEILQFPWTPAYTPCNLFINGDYRGCYLLIESIKRNKDCRINIDKETGYIVERDPYWWKQENYFETNYFSDAKRYRWTWKYPDDDAVNDELESYIKSFINQTEQAIKDGTYEKYIDLESFARWILANDILGIWDSGGTNLYLSKYDNTPDSRLQIPVLWDFDSVFWMEPGDFSRCHNAPNDFYFHNLFNNKNKAFVKVYQQLWNQVRNTLGKAVNQFVLDFTASDEGKALAASRTLNYERWEYTEYTTMEEDTQEAIDWFNTHLPLLDEQISQLSTDAINTVTDNQTLDNTTYNLSGIRTSGNSKGIVIRNKRLYLPKR